MLTPSHMRTGSKKVQGHNVSLSTLCLAFIKQYIQTSFVLPGENIFPLFVSKKPKQPKTIGLY